MSSLQHRVAKPHFLQHLGLLIAQLCTSGLLFSHTCAATQEGAAPPRPSHDYYKYKHWRQPEMVVFGDSTADSGRRFAAPASFDFEEIGPFPWKKLYDATDNESKFRAYLPSPGSATNGKVWPDWLRVPEALNFATSSGTATDAFRSLESCQGYTGEGEEYPTGTLEEQITRYFHDILDHTNETLGYTHVISLGGNDFSNVGEAITRYSLGGDGYVDPVPFENVFEIVNGTVQVTFVPFITELMTAWSDGVTRLTERGVTGRILLSNLVSSRGLPGVAGTDQADVLDQVALAVRDAVQATFAPYPQVRVLDFYTLGAALVEQPEIFENLGFSTDITPCLQYQFVVDDTAEIMGTQDLRAADCPRECALCAENVSPCQTCLSGNPSVFMCDDVDSRIFWDPVHFTAAFHQYFGEFMRQCSKDVPNYDRPLVQLACPDAV